MEESEVEADPDFEIHEDNLESMGAFQACNNRWRWMMVGIKAIRIGLDMQAVRLVLWGLKLKDARQVFNDIRLMEDAALEAINTEEAKAHV